MPTFDITGKFTELPTSFTSKAKHTVRFGKLSSEPGTEWVLKEMPHPSDARLEVLAQEFFRVLVPHQPETRLAINASGVYFVLSQKVTGFHGLPEHQAPKFADGTYSGLGQAALISMFLQEIDFKSGNVGLDYLGRVIKIDGDWSLAPLHDTGYKPESFKITPETLARLPWPVDFYAFNWLDLIMEGVAHTTTRFISHTLPSEPRFRNEINQALLRICLLPDSYIEKLVNIHMPGSAIRVFAHIQKRRAQLLNSALQNESFQAYLCTAEVRIDLLYFCNHLKKFKTNDEPILVSEVEQADLREKIEAKRVMLISIVETANECKRLLNQARGFLAGHPTLAPIIEELQKRIQENYHLEPLTALKRELTAFVTDLPAMLESKAACAVLLDEIRAYVAIDPPLNDYIEMQTECLRENWNLASLTKIQDKIKAFIRTISAIRESKSACEGLIEQIRGYLSADPLLTAYIDEMTGRFRGYQSLESLAAIKSLESLAAIKGELTTFVTVLPSIIEKKAVCERRLTEISDLQEPDFCAYVEQTQRRIRSTLDLAVLTSIQQEIPTKLLMAECKQLLNTINLYKIGSDPKLVAFIRANKERLGNISDNSEALLALKSDLQATLTAVRSPEIMAVKSVIIKFRKEAGFFYFSRGKGDKANRIERALEHLPILERARVISGSPNAVLEALASHRLTFIKGYVYKVEGVIDENKAARTFKEFTSIFPHVPSLSSTEEKDAPTKRLIGV